MGDVRITSRSSYAPAVLVTAGALLLYGVTGARTVGLIDSGELTAVMVTGGVAHPTGYPFYSLLGYLVGAPFRHGWADGALAPLAAAWFSHLAGALACGIITFAACRGALHLGAPRARAMGIATLCGFQFLACQTAWIAAAEVEVYALTALLSSLVAWMAVEGLAARSDSGRRRWFQVLCFTFGLAMGNHLTIIVLAPLCLLLLYRLPQGKRTLDSLRGLAMVLLGTSVLLALPLRAALDPAFAWGMPDQFDPFLRHVQGAQYQVWMFQRNGAELVAALGQHLHQLTVQDIPLACFLAALAALRFRNLVALTCAACVVANVFLVLNYDIPDIGAYLLPTEVLLVIASSAALALAARRTAAWNAAIALGVVVVSSQALLAYPHADRRNHRVADTYARTLLASLEPNAVMISDRWDVYAPAICLQTVEGLRSDVTLIDKELLRRSWYYAELQQRDLDLYKHIEESADAFLEAVAPFESGSAFDAARIQEAYIAVHEDLLNAPGRPPYSMLVNTEGIADGWQRIPRALAWRLIPPGQPRPDLPELDLDVIEPGGVPVTGNEALDPRAVELDRDHARMAVERAMVLGRSGDASAAESEIRRAIRLDPRSIEARRLLVALLVQEGRQAEAEAATRAARKATIGRN